MNFSRLCGFALAAVLFTACSDDDDASLLQLADNEDKTISLTAEAEEYEIPFVSSSAWQATVTSDVADWITVAPLSGEGLNTEQHITVSALANMTTDERVATVTITAGGNKIEIDVTQEAATADAIQEALNNALAVNRFAKFDVAEINEAAATIKFCTELNNTSSAWAEWNADWATKQYTAADGKKYRVPTALEMQLLMPGYAEPYRVGFTKAIDNLTLNEKLPEEMGGESTSVFRTSANKIEVGTDPQTAYAVYAIRFTGTAQRSAYFYRWYNAGSEADAHLCIRVKAIADDNVTIDQIADNDEFWSGNYIEMNIPACGINFGSSAFLVGANGDYWTSTSGALNQDNFDTSAYAVNMTFSDSQGYLSDSRKDNLYNLRMIAAE